MSCFHPLVAYPGKLTENGKVKYIPVKYNSRYDEGYQSIDWIKEKQAHSKTVNGQVYYPTLLPCGKCIGCRLDKSREWALRCMMELKSQEGLAFFLTLTYNENKVPVSYYPDPDTGEALPCYTLRLDDLQRFWKRLRKALPDTKIRYFASGEYGKDTWRPHYHAIVYGFRPSDLVVTQVNETGNYYDSDKIRSIWANGNIVIADVTFDTCAYVARYTAKKNMTIEDGFFEKHNLEKPFLVMSRRPGIGWSYMEEHRQYFELDRIYVGGENPVDGTLPRSFLRKLEEVDPVIYEQVKARREKFGNVYERAVAMSRKVPYEKLLYNAEQNLLARSRQIRRNKV